MKDRIKQIRKHFNKSQTEFGSKINLTKHSISAYEKGDREPTERAIADICREYHVNKQWLETGKGNMFVVPDNNLDFEEICTDIINSNNENSDLIKRIVKAFWELPDDKKSVIWELIEKIAGK